MEMSGLMNTLKCEGIVFLPGAAGTREEAVDLAGRFGTIAESEEVNPCPYEAADPDSTSGDSSALDLHTDASRADVPFASVILYCERSDPSGGGATTWLHVDKILNSLISSPEGRAAHEVLVAAKVPVAPSPSGTAKLGWFHVFSRNAAGTTIRFNGTYMRFGVLAAEEAGCPAPAEVLSALDVLQRTIRELEPGCRTLAPGDIVVVDNCRTLHGRTAIDDLATRSIWRVRLNPGATATV